MTLDKLDKLAILAFIAWLFSYFAKEVGKGMAMHVKNEPWK
jgi:hypothetical protein